MSLRQERASLVYSTLQLASSLPTQADQHDWQMAAHHSISSINMGHAQVNQVLSELLGSSTNSRLGFSMILDDAGDFAVRFNSRSVNSLNPSFPGRTVPESMRQQILDAIRQSTGRGAHSAQ